MWFSETANELLYEEYFTLTNIEKDFLPVFKRFYQSEKLRTCPVSGEDMEADERLSKVDLKIRYYDTELKFLEEIIKTVANRTFQIKNAIEWQQFQSGF